MVPLALQRHEVLQLLTHDSDPREDMGYLVPPVGA